MDNKEETLADLKSILGNMGIEILFAINEGAIDIETIKIFSGLPLSCVKGRIPVLLDLNLIKESPKGFSLTERGIRIKTELKSKV